MSGAERSARHFRSEFSEKEYNKWIGSTWPLPSRLGDPGPDGKAPLAAWRESSGDGVSALLPIVGIIACSHAHHSFGLSIEEIARLLNVDPSTVQRAVVVLEAAGLVRRSVRERRGEWMTHWNVSKGLCGGSARDGKYFSVPMRLVYGGVWAMMPLVMRSIYLGAATRASVASTLKDHWVFDEISPLADVSDILAFMKKADELSPLRLALITLPQLSAASGVKKRTLSDRLPELRAPGAWEPIGRREGDRLRLAYSPLTTYPSVHRNAFVVFFRDHVPHLPWTFLNDPLRDDLWEAGGQCLAEFLNDRRPAASLPRPDVP